MEKRAVLAIVLSLVVVVLWSIFFAPAPPLPPSEVSEPALSPSESPAGVGSPQPAAPVNPGSMSSTAPTTERPPGAPATQEVFVTVDTGVARFTLTSQGASVRAVQLQAYHTTCGQRGASRRNRTSSRVDYAAFERRALYGTARHIAWAGRLYAIADRGDPLGKSA